MPDFSLEDRFPGPVAGLDEVGRGPWAGPVVACAVVIDRTRFPASLGAELDDSKKLSAAKREALHADLTACVDHAIGDASVEEIDRLNILAASHLAMRRAFDGLKSDVYCALVDGNRDPGLGVRTLTVVKGDSKSLSIAAASIIAKVHRDRIMADLAVDHPGYGWETNAGYGTKAHRTGLSALGITPHHRQSFAPIRKLIS